MRTYCVYIVASTQRTLYVGVTSDLRRRVCQHKARQVPGFTSRYHVDRLVWYEVHRDVRAAITRERQLKGWSRARKIALIEEQNAEWDDLSPVIGLPVEVDRG